MNTYDYYGEASALAEAAKRAGFSVSASTILSAMEEGATGTEIFMALRARLEELITEGQFPSQLMSRARALHEKLTNALK